MWVTEPLMVCSTWMVIRSDTSLKETRSIGVAGNIFGRGSGDRPLDHESKQKDLGPKGVGASCTSVFCRTPSRKADEDAPRVRRFSGSL
jgi:hypothetical protein